MPFVTQLIGRKDSTFYLIAQYVIPGLLAFGMLIGLGKSLSRRSIFNRIVADQSGDKLDALSWVQFEDLVHQYFLERDYKVATTKEGADGGVDLRLSKNGHGATVQCKHWRNKKVGVVVIREQYGIMTAERADQCFVVTSGEFTKEAKDWAADKAIGLIDGEQLRYLLGIFAFDHVRMDRIEQLETPSSSSCPNCRSEMVLRTAKRGKNTGSKFWGCSMYPKCRGTRGFS